MEISVKAKKAYDVYIEDEIFSLKDYLDLEKRYFVVVDSNLPKEKVELFKKELKDSSFYYLEAIEENKNLITVEVILEELLTQNFSKSDFLIGLGGGIIGDIAAFIASIYKRGMNYIYFPTSTTAMIDVAIGGKNGVNLLKSKNIVGTITPPYKVVIDLSFLNSLPEKHYSNGLVEAIKMAMLFDKDLFELFLKKDFKNIKEIVSRSLKIKKEVVEKDEEDLDYRNLLNFGHTLAHAIEASSDYAISHGEAVARGILVDTHNQYLKDKLKTIFKSLKIRYNYKLKIDKIKSYIYSDKKIKDEKIRIILLEDLEKYIVKYVTVDEYIELLKEGVSHGF